jgi:hypothetical protein
MPLRYCVTSIAAEICIASSSHRLSAMYTYVNGDAGWDWADFQVFPTDPKNKPFTFAILFLWTKAHGAWVCKGDFFVNGSFRSGKLTPADASK